MAKVLTQQFANTRYLSRHSSGVSNYQYGSGVSHSRLNKTSESNSWRNSNADQARNLPQNDDAAMKFVSGQRVEAQYRVGSTWRPAIVRSVEPAFLILQFDGWEDMHFIPIERARYAREEDHTNQSSLKAFVSRGSAVLSNSPRSPREKPRSKPTKTPSTPSKPRAPSKPARVRRESLKQLQVLKQTAVINEDFLTAAKLKMQIEKVTVLESERVAAVNKENFLLAMDIKKQIEQLLKPVHEQPKQCK